MHVNSNTKGAAQGVPSELRYDDPVPPDEPASRYQQLRHNLRHERRTWLVTGAAGFIGSNLAEELLQLDQVVIGLDNFSTGHWHNLEDVRKCVGEQCWENFTLVEGDIRDLDICYRACTGVDYVLHQAALGSVPRSIENPIATNANNVTGFLNMLVAARDAGVKRFVYAASSSTYGDSAELPKVEDRTGKPLSPYAVSKYVNELYAQVFERCYGLETVGLRYFNVFGRRQDPNGAYAAVIPHWVSSLLRGERCVINGDGETSRDFCYVANVLQANLLAMTAQGAGIIGEVYNVAVGERTTLNELYRLIRDSLAKYFPELSSVEPEYGDFRPGDMRHSQAAIMKIQLRLGYKASHSLAAGLRETLDWYVCNSQAAAPTSSAALT